MSKARSRADAPMDGSLSRRAALIGGASLATLVAGWRSGAPSAAAVPAKRIEPGSLPRRRPSPNPHLSGNFAPVDTEFSKMHLPVEGSIPSELRGTLLRNGPNPIAPISRATTGSSVTG